MRRPPVLASKRLAAALFCVFVPLVVTKRANAVPPRITQTITDSRRVTLRGNVYPLARPEYDRGLAPSSLPMNRMLLLLKRSPQQEAALDALLAEQQDRSSPNFHRWLTPAQFGARFGPADQDLQKIEGWLESQGFSIDAISNGRTVIEFSGSAAEVQSAFHTQIHRYVLPSGVEHWANSTNPEIPAALAAVVAGIRSLNSFHPRPLSRVVRETRAARPSSETHAAPMFTFAASGPCSAIQSFGLAPAGNICFMIAPSDFATIYNVNPLYSAGINGTGETIAIANDSNINLADVSNFRSLMGLPAKNPQVILATGSDPGLNTDESEAILDAEWSGAIAKDATIDLVIAPSSNTTFGGDLAAEYVIDNNLAPILSYSFGACENAGIGNFYGPLWQQAAAEGITVIVASGDNGSAACDASTPTATSAQPATGGLQVSGLASTPDDVAVGGTDFSDVANPGQYWNLGTSSSTSQSSALGYIPETTWNESCTNAVFSTSPLNAQFGSSPEAACNNTTLAANGFVVPSGSSGGVSTVYAKPSWQDGVTPNDKFRDLPDLSLFAGTGNVSASFYYVCESDLSNPPATCSLSGTIFGAGGTSVSAQAFAGIMALVDQKAGGPQGNIDPALYSLAGQGTNTCPSASPTASCIFYDVTTGTNAMPCAYSPTVSPNCVATTTGDLYGILEDSNQHFAYDAGTGYDLATGLGSINAANLADAAVWTASSSAPDFSMTSSNATINLGSNGQGSMSVTIAPANGFTGSVYLTCPGLPVGDTCSFNPTSPLTIGGPTTVMVTVSGTIAAVPGDAPRPAGPAGSLPGTVRGFALACLALLFLWSLRLRRRSTALAALAFAALLVAGCGSGGSSSSTNSSGGSVVTGAPFTTTLTATTCTNGAGCSSGTTHSLAFTVQ